MAFKDRWSRMIRKSFSSNSSSGNDTSTIVLPKNLPVVPVPDAPSTPPATPPASAVDGPELAKSPSSKLGLAKTLTWRSQKSAAAAEEKKKKKEQERQEKLRQQRKKVHPSQRPLTEMNMRHQELLGAFTMNFGRSGRRPSQGGRTSYSNVSPGGSRHASLDLGGIHIHGRQGSGADRRLSSKLAHHEPSDVEEEDPVSAAVA